MPSSTMKALADDYGYQLAFLKSDPELYRVFQQAVDNGWDATRFTAAVRKTGWYRTTSATNRKAQQLRYSDPATYKQQVTNATAQVQQLARQIGAEHYVSQSGRVDMLAKRVVDWGWDTTQLRDYMARYINTHTTPARGEAGQVQSSLKQTAFRNGVQVSDGWITDRAKAVVQGRMTVEDAQQQIRNTYAKRLAPGFENELAAGQDLYDIASPYMQTMAKTLELNPSDINLFDPTIRKALASSNEKDGQVGSVPLWQFERDLRKDDRWLKTNAARNEVDKTVRGLSQAFGLGV